MSILTDLFFGLETARWGLALKPVGHLNMNDLG